MKANWFLAAILIVLFSACGDETEVQQVCDTAPRVQDSFCEQDAYTLPNGNVVSLAGEYDVFLGADGDCGEAVVYVLTTFAVEEQVEEVTICEGESHQLSSGESVNQPGTYTVSVERPGTCNLDMVTILRIQDDSITEVDVLKCPDTEYILPDGSGITAEGTYLTTINSTIGCDSTIRTTIVNDVNQGVEEIILAEICLGDTYTLPSGGMITPDQTGTTDFISSFLTASGCDSTVRTSLTVHPTFESSESVTISSGQSYTLPDGTVVTDAGSYTTTFMSVNGCDSVIVTNLSVN